MAARTPAPVVIEGRHIRLEPLAFHHVPDLFAAGGGDDEVWRWLPVVSPGSEYEMRMIVEQRLAQQAAGDAILFAAVDRPTYRAVGWIAYLDISVADERLDIGWHWLGRSLWYTPALAEMHLLLLHNAFDTLRFGRVQWQIDHDDVRSRDAVIGIGARSEGTLRRHARRPDGTWRDTLVYALLASEWPAVKGRGIA
ncbi:GNAT family N-acetyltransferase [Streptomyces sp. 7N604]|uniref:GNAT family N-acetyltransferase n=1 Tax=Streptomyces sp. 7N604 TaxID=3457415 RepID=UPI003FD3AACD